MATADFELIGDAAQGDFVVAFFAFDHAADMCLSHQCIAVNACKSFGKLFFKLF